MYFRSFFNFLPIVSITGQTVTADVISKTGNGYTYRVHNSASGILLVEASYSQHIITITSGAEVTAQVERHS